MPSLVKCAFCGKPFNVKPYRAKSGLRLCCNYRCSAKFRVARGLFKHSAIPSETIVKMSRLYRTSRKSVEQIAGELGVSRSLVFLYARRRRWRRFRRFSGRTRSRNAAMRQLGRKLKKGEHVHHIDLDPGNDSDDNLHVFPDGTAHGECHASLGFCAQVLIKRGLISFSRRAGRYHVSHGSLRVPGIIGRNQHNLLHG